MLLPTDGTGGVLVDTSFRLLLAVLQRTDIHHLAEHAAEVGGAGKTGLLGTVIGMIKSFAALANAGSPDSVALSAGISEALVNTAFGIATGALAVISYNYFTSKIDKLTYSIDEVGFTIVQTYAATHK